MDQHPIPRQITTFEFKLIGFMTLRQFLYLIIFVPLGFIVFKIFPIPLLNILLGLITALIGFALAFLPINDRPLEVWIRNFVKRVNSPTQYFFHKNNPPISIFQSLYFVSDPHLVFTHIESQQKLSAYLAKTKQVMGSRPQITQVQQNPILTSAQPQNVASPIAPAENSFDAPVVKQPFLIGVVKNNKQIPLPGILIYVKDQSNNPVRLLKTNPHGIFATYSPLPVAEYVFEIKDPKEGYFFDTIKLKVDGASYKPLEFYSKELL